MPIDTAMTHMVNWYIAALVVALGAFSAYHFGRIEKALERLRKEEERIVSTLSDAIAAANTSADGAIQRVQADVAALQAQIAALQAQVNSGGATADDLSNLAALKAKLDALDPSNPATLPAGS